MFCEHWKLCSHLLYLWRLKCSKITNISIKVGSTGGQTLWFRTYRHRVLKSAFWQVSRSLYTLKLKTHFLVSVLKCARVSICCSETERYGILLQFLDFNFSWKLLKFWLYGWVDIVGDQKSRAAIITLFCFASKALCREAFGSGTAFCWLWLACSTFLRLPLLLSHVLIF